MAGVGYGLVASGAGSPDICSLVADSRVVGFSIRCFEMSV